MAERVERMWMETTRQSVVQTVADIQKLLSKYHAESITIGYDRGEIVSVSFELHVMNRYLAFRLPSKWQGVLQRITERKKRKKVTADMEEKAKRIAWRQTLHWVEAQLGYVDTGQVKTEQVFFAYLIGDRGKTLFEAIEEKGYRMLDYKREGEAE